MKVKLAICLKEEIYQERLIKCLMKYYGESYEFHVFSSIDELLQGDSYQYEGFLLEDKEAGEVEWTEPILDRALFLQEEDKYQEVFKIMERLEKLLSKQGKCFVGEKNIKPIIIAVHSVEIPAMQIPLSALLSEIIGEKKKTVFVDLQEYSGFIQEGELGLEDMLAMIIGGNYNQGRALSTLGHNLGWDYIYPLKNQNCLVEVTDKVLLRLTQHLIEDFGYEAIVLNIGTTVANVKEILSICNMIFLPCTKGNIGKWREKRFIEEIGRKGDQSVLYRIHRVEIPTISGTDGDWKKATEQWKWGILGDYLRKIIWEENSLGKDL